MACKGILKIIRDFAPAIEESLEIANVVRVDLFDLRDDEKNYFRSHFRKKYDVVIEAEFDCPDVSCVPHYVAVIRRKK